MLATGHPPNMEGTIIAPAVDSGIADLHELLLRIDVLPPETKYVQVIPSTTSVSARSESGSMSVATTAERANTVLFMESPRLEGRKSTGIHNGHNGRLHCAFRRHGRPSGQSVFIAGESLCPKGLLLVVVEQLVRPGAYAAVRVELNRI